MAVLKRISTAIALFPPINQNKHNLDSSSQDFDTFCMKASKKTKSLCNPAAIKFHKDRHDLPSHDALAQILPDYRYLLSEANTELHRAAQQEQKRPTEREEATQANKPNINHTYRVHHHPHKRLLHDFEDDPHVAEINNLQTKEVENYRSAMSKMADDIIALRTQVVTLEAENSQLRSDLSLHQDLGRNLLDDTDIDKNDSEEELLKLQRVQQQQEDLQHQQSRLAKMAILEATVKQQEKVIQKMENALDSKLKGKNKQSGEKRLVEKKQRTEFDHRKEEVEPAMAAENAHLREELDRNRLQPAAIIIQQSAQTKKVLLAKERLNLLNKLENAEARVQTLEAQLVENSELWGRQKQKMLTKLNEHRHGFVRTSTTILHNVPSRTVSHSLHQQSRQRKQKPIK
ncbi:hypothetical protein PAMP_019784 [Pampus punctatissimus]